MSYRVWMIINPPSRSEYRAVRDPDEGARLINRVAQAHLRNPNIWCNVFGLQTDATGSWEEWDDENGDGVNKLADAIWEAEARIKVEQLGQITGGGL